MKNKSKIILIIAIILVIALIARVVYGIIRGEKKPIATIEVSYVDNEGNTKDGTIKVELNAKEAPISVANFIKLANNGFYDNLTFHRIMPDFMIQGGDPQGTGAGSAKLSDLNKKIQAGSSDDYTYSIKGEFPQNQENNMLKFEKGVIAMARSDFSNYGLKEEGFNSASCQFFIVNTDKQSTLDGLNNNYAPFGKVIEGYEFVEAMSNVKLKDPEGENEEKSTPETAPIIKSIRVETYGADYGIPKTINFDEINAKVQQYQQYYQQLMSSYNSDSASAEATQEIGTDFTTEEIPAE